MSCAGLVCPLLSYVFAKGALLACLRISGQGLQDKVRIVRRHVVTIGENRYTAHDASGGMGVGTTVPGRILLAVQICETISRHLAEIEILKTRCDWLCWMRMFIWKTGTTSG